MAINKLISIKGPVLDAIEDMGIDHGRDVRVFTRWAVRAENKIGGYYSYRKKIAVLKVDGCRAELPCEAAFAQYVVLGNYGCDCEDLFNKIVSCTSVLGATTTDTFLIVDASETEPNPILSPLKWEIQDNCLVFSSDFDAREVTVQYLGLEVDEEGFPKVMENHIDAIVAFIMHKFALRSRFTPVKMDAWDVQNLAQTWDRECSSARASDAEISDSDRQEIVAMINDPLLGHGLEVGVNPPSRYS